MVLFSARWYRPHGEPMNTAEVSISPEELSSWRSYIGRREVRSQVLDVPSLHRYAAAVGADLDVVRAAPPLAHWAYFLEAAPADELGIDGHVRLGRGLLPSIRLQRRMFASSSVAFFAPLTLNKEAELTLTLADIRHKSGKSGELLLIDVDRSLTQEGRELIAERQTLVYRGIGAPLLAVESVESDPRAGETVWIPGPLELFRFSAVTFNAHRIHYDLAYAQAEEGYPALVVHGPLTAVRLFAFARSRQRPGVSPRRFQFRALAPLFVDQRVRLVAGEAPGTVEAIRCDGEIAMSAQWELAPAPAS
jgi:3-methylfumaryl-CoA hydratase